MRRNPVFREGRRASSASAGGRDCFERAMGERIVQLRRRQGWDRAELADRLGVPLERLKKWEQGANLPSVGMLAPLARTLDVSVDELVTGEPAPAAGFSSQQKEAARSYLAGLVRLMKLEKDVRRMSSSRP